MKLDRGTVVLVGLDPTVEAVQGDKVVLVFNFFDELRRLVPTN